MKNNPAFPGPSNTGFQTGMTKIEFFALNSPDEIPGWFVHVPPERNFPELPLPYLNRDAPEADKQDLQDWRDDVIDELPEHLKWYSEQAEAHSKGIVKWDIENNIQRFFQWRIFFAENLLNKLNETIPKPVFDRREDKA